MKFIPSFSVSMEIHDVLYLSFHIPASRVRPYIPEPLVPATFHGEIVFLSVVCFHSRNVRIAELPCLPFSYDQINVRTYVKDPATGKDGVLFLFSGITSRFVAFSTNILGFPWKYLPFVLKATKNSADRYDLYETTGMWKGPVKIAVEEDLSFPATELPYYLTGAIQHITSPETGFYNIRGMPLRFEVKHPRITPRVGRALHLDFPFLISSGLLEAHELSKPESVLLVDKATFTIFLPAQWAGTRH